MNDTPEHLGEGVWSLNVSGSLTREDIARLRAAIAALPASARSVALLGGSKIFNSGATRASLLDSDCPITEYARAIPRLLLEIPVPIVAGLAGHAIGGGLLLGLWCDQVVLAEECLYGANFMALGFTPGMGATVALEDALGAFLAREMLYTGRLLTGRELRARGALLPHILPKSEVEPWAVSLAREIAALPSASVRLLRRALTESRRTRLEAALRDEARMHDEAFAQAEVRCRIREMLPE
ncbi:MAG TPA: enoyl-CoA hydratase-related protein [Candidatus Binatia bacterium]|nr:enoyl-CoA hydratase-related protein [Candidatus Binatia bacterium]